MRKLLPIFFLLVVLFGITGEVSNLDEKELYRIEREMRVLEIELGLIN